MRTYERHRAYIHSHLLEFEKNITDFKTYTRAQVQQILKRRRAIKFIPPEVEGRWTYIPPTERDSKSESEPKSKKQKVELSPDEVCVICLEKRKTHAFLHANIAQVQWLLLRNYTSNRLKRPSNFNHPPAQDYPLQGPSIFISLGQKYLPTLELALTK